MSFFWIGVLLLSLTAGAQDYSFEEFPAIVKRPQKIRVAVPDFQPLSQLPAHDNSCARLTGFMREVVGMTGLLELVSPDAYPALALPGEKEDFETWKAINTDYIIRGDAALLDEGRYQIEFRCFDLKQGKMVLGKRYTGEPALFNRMVMRFMDEFIGYLTGKKGALDSRIAYVSDASGRNEIRLVDTDGSNDQAITSNRTLNLSPSWSPDGRYLLYQGYRARNPDLYIIDNAKGKETKLYGASGLNLPGKFSPDGRSIAFAREGADGNIDLYLISVTGQELKRLTSASSIEVSPAWSPDGKLMAFVSDRAGNPQVYLLDLSRGPESAGNPAVRLTYEGDYNSSPAWSPDGQYLAFAGRVGGQFDLFLIFMSGENRSPRRLTASAANEENPAWSPDSRFLVYDSNKSGNYDIYLMSIYGGEPRKITSKAAKERMPAWSPQDES